MVTVGELQYVMSIKGEDDVRGALEGTSQEMAAAGDAADQAGAQVQGMGDSMQSAGADVTSAGDAAQGAGADLASVGDAADMAGQQVLELGDSADQAGAGMTGTGDAADQVGAQFTELGDAADQTGAQVQGAADAASQAGGQVAGLGDAASQAGAGMSGAGDAADSAGSQVQGFGDAVEQAGATSQEQSGIMTGAFRDVGTAVVGAFAIQQVTNFATGMLRTAGSVDSSNRMMAAAFGESGDAVQDWASTWASQLGETESSMQNVVSGLGFMLVQLGFTQDEAADLTLEFSNLAAALGNAMPHLGGVTHAAEALSAGITGSRQRMDAYGISIRQVDIDNELAAQGLSNLTGEALKQAEAQAFLSLVLDNTAGSMRDWEENGVADATAAANRFEAAIGEIREELATTSTTVLEPFIGLLATGLSEEWSRNAILAGVFATALHSKVIPRLRESITQAGGARAAMSGLARSMGWGLGIAGVATAATMVWEQHSGAQQRARQRAEELRDALIETEGALSGVTAELLQQAMLEGGGNMHGVIDEMNELGLTADEVIGKLELGNVEWDEWIGQVMMAADAAGMSSAEQFRLIGMFEQMREAVSTGRDDMDAYAQATDDAGGATGDLAGDMHEAADAAERARSELDELLGTLSEITDQHFSLESAQIAQQEALESLSDAVDENGTSLDINTDAGRTNRGMLQDLVGSHEDMVQALIDHGATEEQVQLVMAGSRQAIEDQMFALGFTEDQVRDYITALDDIDEFVETDILPGVGTWQAHKNEVDSYRWALEQIPSVISTTVSAGLTGMGASLALQQRHTGGLVPGHAGREVPMMLLGREEVITESDPRHQSNMGRAAGMSGGGGTTVIELRASDRMGRALVESLQAEVRRVGGSGPDSVQIALGR